MDCKTDVCMCPGNMAPEEIPACVLADIAGRIDDSQTPWRIHNNGERAALAAYALNRFAEQTGLAQDGETTWTVITDFLADMMHLCAELGIITPDKNLLPDLLEGAEFHFSADDEDE